jgi:hypothetical protein
MKVKVNFWQEVELVNGELLEFYFLAIGYLQSGDFDGHLMGQPYTFSGSNDVEIETLLWADDDHVSNNFQNCPEYIYQQVIEQAEQLLLEKGEIEQYDFQY